MTDEIDYNALTSYGPDEPANEIGNVKVYDGNTMYITTRLSDIPQAIITSVEDDEGREVQGLFIPFRNSGVTVTPKKNVILVCKAQMAHLPSRKYTHLLTQIMDESTASELRRMGYKQGYIGHLRPANTPKPRKNRKY